MGLFSTANWCKWLLPGLDFPIDQEQQADQKQWTGNYQVNRPIKAPGETDNVTGSQSEEEDPADPFPTPGNSQDEQDSESGEEMHEKGQQGLPEIVPFTEYIQGKQADENSQQDTHAPGRPEEGRVDGFLHGGILSDAAVKNSIQALGA
jgi:hypothetical protein